MVCATRDSTDGIVDYASGLGDAMTDLHGATVELVLSRAAGGWSTRALGVDGATEHPAAGLPQAVAGCDALLLHYNPFSWGRWGFAPSLVTTLARLHRRRPELAIGIMVHERYLHMHDVRSTAMGTWQRIQFHGVLRSATAAFASIELWTRDLRRQTHVPVAQLPICSNVPDARARRDAVRARLELPPATLAVAAFGGRHPARLTSYMERAANAIAGAGQAVVMLNLGAEPPQLPGLDGSAIRVVTPGRLDRMAVAEHLAAADLYLAPFVDGVSSRRTTVMAALQHALPVVGTDGSSTDPAMRAAREALLLTPAADAGAFAAAALELASDPARRARQASAGRLLYETSHDWPIACRVALDGLGMPARG